jgi:hypothetical protein
MLASFRFVELGLVNGSALSFLFALLVSRKQ